MRILDNNQIDLKKWDETVLRSRTPLVFAQAFYLNATCPGWKALATDDYKTIMPVTAQKKLGINYLIQPPFTPQLGIFGNTDDETAGAFFSLLQKKYKYISIELNASNNFNLPGTKAKRTYVIYFEKEYKYNSNTKRNIAKAIKGGLKVIVVENDEILSLSKKYLQPFLEKKLKISAKQIHQFDRLLKNSISEKTLSTFIVKDIDDKICGIAHFISNGQHAVYLKGTNFDRNSGSMHLLMDHALEYYKKKKVAMFDFGGGQSDSLAQFYSGFGALPLNYITYKFNNLPTAIKWLKK